MRYWRPYPAPAVSDLLTRGAEQFLIVPTYPQYSSATSGSTLDFVLAAVTDRAPTASVHVVGQWPTQPGFVAALATGAVDHLTTWAESETESSRLRPGLRAHSLPQRLVDAGDVYPQHVAQTVAAVATVIDRNCATGGSTPGPTPWGAISRHDWRFRARVGPVRWLEPDVTDLVADLAAGGVKRLLVVPVSFTCEHIETLLELDVELREHAESRGVTDFARVPVPGTGGPWLASLAASLAEMAYSGEVSAHV